MQLKGVSLNGVTYFCSLKAYGSVRAIDGSQKMHADIESVLVEMEAIVMSCLVLFYTITPSREAWFLVGNQGLMCILGLQS